LKKIESSGNFEKLLDQSQASVNNVFVFKIQDYRIFYTIEDDTVLLVDLIKKESQKIRINSKNPTFNRTINPTFNRTINPTFNRTINPIFNRTINPTFNRTINPTFNRTINPIFNRTINPTFNRTINPTFNRTINPKYNSTINPKMNPSFNGKYVFDTNGKNLYFIVDANDDVILIYDFENEIKSYGVKYEGGYALFDFNVCPSECRT
jgi:hypothetical protein